MVLSDWVYNAVNANEVLTLNRDYFRLAKPIERRVYEIARKHCGQKRSWKISLDKLYIKSGSQANKREFRRYVKEITEKNHLPDYEIYYSREEDMIEFFNRRVWWDEEDKSYPRIQHKKTYDTALALCPSGVDVYKIEQEWFRYWKQKGRPLISNPDKSFLGFVSKKYLFDE